MAAVAPGVPQSGEDKKKAFEMARQARRTLGGSVFLSARCRCSERRRGLQEMEYRVELFGKCVPPARCVPARTCRSSDV